LESFNYQNVVDGQAIGISITGLIIVFTSLILISLFIFLLPIILGILDTIFPEAKVEEVKSAPTKQDEGSTVAAIGFAIHQSQSGK
jgi:Na+-transporting methylmalonyl-CoA/oxaloacetate decarboxylase gamma subunit